MNEEIRDKLVEVFLKCCQFNEDWSEEKETEELDLDSVDVLEFVLEVEDEFGIEYDDFAEFSLHMDTIGDMLDFMTEIVKQRRSA